MLRIALLLGCLLGSVVAVQFESSWADDFFVLQDAQQPITLSDGKTIDIDPAEMMANYWLGKITEALDRREAEYEKIETPEQMAEYQQRMKGRFLDAIGGLPERTPLNPRVVAKEKRDGYRIEKIIFESRPRHYVTAMLYLPGEDPDATAAPCPGVLVPCGHSQNGKAIEAYQRASILLAKNGMVSFCYDPIDQGERFQMLDANGKPVIGGTTAHSVVGVGCTLLGHGTATFRIWDGIRAIDYLAGRPEVDPNRIGCTGNSGGGTMTSYLMALDERIVCAAPSCYLCGFRRLCETIGPQDGEQNIHGQLGFGMDHADYIMMRAPKPTLMCTATQDFFDIGGAWGTFRQAKRFYTRHGFAERVDLIETDDKHGFTKPLRIAAVRWMRRWLLGKDDAITEPDFPVATDEQMQCTPKGQVMLLEGARSTYDINIEIEEELATRRKAFWQRTQTSEALEEVRRVAGIRNSSELARPTCTLLGSFEMDGGYPVRRLICQVDEGSWLPALAFLPKEGGEKLHDGQAYLYVNAQGKHIDANPDGPIRRLVDAGHMVLAVDLPGFGELSPGVSGSGGIAKYLGKAWPHYYSADLLGTSYLAMRTEHILIAAQFLASYEAGARPNQIHLISIGRRVGPPALHAAALEPELFATVSFTKRFTPWADLVRRPLETEQFENVVHGALKTYDLPNLWSTLPQEKVKTDDLFESGRRL